MIAPDCSSVAGSSFITESAVVVFPQPDSPASPSASPAIERQVDAVDDRPVVAVGDPQVLDLEQRLAVISCSSRSRGLTYSSNR